MPLYRQEALPERRDGLGYSFRMRREKRFVSRITRRRCSILVFLSMFLFLIFFSRNLSFPYSNLEKMEQKFSEEAPFDLLNTPSSMMYSESVDVVTDDRMNTVETSTGLEDQNMFQMDVPKKKKYKHRKQYGPCEIGFVNSIDVLKEPETYMNVTDFSLNYITKEENLNEYDMFHPSFGGHQTFKEREQSFYAKNQTLHCGFVKGPGEAGNTGFDLDIEDKAYMFSCKVVVSSCIFGSSDFLRKPTKKKMSEYSKANVCFVMFIDSLTMDKLASEGQVRDEGGYIGLWRIIIVRNLPYTDMRMVGKVPKFLSHRLFPLSRFSIWIDSKLRLNADPMQIIDYFLWRTQSEYAISNHYDRHCVWDEVLQNKRLNKYNHTTIDEQFTFYQYDGLTKFNESDENAPLPSYVPEGSFIIRAHTPMANLFSCLWFNEVNRFTSRDQLSFAYTYLKLNRMNPGKAFRLNMFKDCERRALAKLFHHRSEIPSPTASG